MYIHRIHIYIYIYMFIYYIIYAYMYVHIAKSDWFWDRQGNLKKINPSNLNNILDILDAYIGYTVYIYTYIHICCAHKQHSAKMIFLDEENAREGLNPDLNCTFNWKAKVLTNSWYIRTAHAIIFPFTLCRKHVSKNPSAVHVR